MHPAVKEAVQTARASISAMLIAPPSGLLSSKRQAKEMNEALSGLENEIERLRATLLNIQAMAERGNPIDNGKLAKQCFHALNPAEELYYEPDHAKPWR